MLRSDFKCLGLEQLEGVPIPYSLRERTVVENSTLLLTVTLTVTCSWRLLETNVEGRLGGHGLRSRSQSTMVYHLVRFALAL